MARDAVNDLNTIITTCLDGRYGYEQAAEHASDAQLKSLFETYAQQRAAFATELAGAVQQLGGTPTDTGSVTAAFHRGWIGLKDALTGGDKGVLGECIRGEEYAVKQYQDALGDADVPAAAKTPLARQHGEITQALTHMQQLHASHA